MLSDKAAFHDTVPDALAVLTGGLNSAFVAVLQEWITSGDLQKRLAIAEILQTFNTGDPFYSLSRELIINAAGEENAEIIAKLRAAMGLPIVGLWEGEMVSFLEGRIAALAPWKEDDNPRLCTFARELSQQWQKELDMIQMNKISN